MANHGNDVWEVFALRWGRSEWKRFNIFLMDSRPQEPFVLNYFVWVIRNAEQTIVVDCGFDAPFAKRRGREPFDDPPTLLRQFGVEPSTVKTVIVTHMHFDHAGCLAAFPQARFHIQKADFEAATSPDLAYAHLRYPYDVEHAKQVLDYVYAGRVQFHDDNSEVAPGITVHRIDGHATGLQAVRINTARGQLVLASDAAPFYELFLDYRVNAAVIDAKAMLQGYDRLRALASSIDHILPGHDPMVCELYPVADAGAAFAYRLDVAPSRSLK